MIERRQIELIIQLIINMNNHNGNGQELIQIDKLEGESDDRQLPLTVMMCIAVIHLE